MSFVITLFIILIPLCMLMMSWLFAALRVVFHALAACCAYVFGIISALAVYEILRDETVFMTNIHRVFENKYFLVTGSYLGSYGIYILLKWTLQEMRAEQ
ncbi:transposase [Paenibacillus sp. HWE-109]|uniref:transposase n=1 Tax=Paenibacillus sp. HWE-109 TaxID=1306526 RepID=UPI001EE0E494|nr:transposase [Paenibacillus sp. HWE-109]UKS27613.1 transposase [Paenibacillus sp. HWE-109]